MIGLDVTMQALLTKKETQQLRDTGTKAGAFLADMTDYQARRRWRENSVKRIIEHRQYFLHFFLRDYRPSQIVIYIRPKIFHSIKHRLDKFISVFRPP